MQAQILSFVVPLIALIFGGVFFSLWWKDRAQLHVLAFAASYSAITIGVALNIWIFQGITPLGIVTYHTLAMGSVMLLMWGTAKRLNQTVPIGACIFATVLTSGLLYYVTVLQAIDAMKMAQNVASALMFTIMAVTLWFAHSDRWLDRIVIWLCASFACFGFVKPMLTIILQETLGDTPATASILMSLHVLALATLLTLLALCLVAMVVFDNLETEREDAAEDMLSGLSNRRAFLLAAEAMLARARDDSKLVSLIVADIDHFKKVNDTWGHAVGDQVIAEFGRLIQTDIRPGDIAGRIGGEEFCILAWNCDAMQASALAERIRQAAGQISIRQNGQAIEFTASFGVALWDPREGYDRLFERADAALYEAKNGGRNRVCIADEGAATATVGPDVGPESGTNVVALKAKKA